jgi:GAF domain-containing protein/HAMP domain-containing protein
MRFWTRSLTARLVIYFLLLALVPLIIVSYVAYNSGREALKRDVLNHLSTTAILKEDEINRWIADKKRSTRLLAQTPIVRQHSKPLVTELETSPGFLSAYEVLGDYLTAVLAEEPDFLEIFILTDVGGKVILSTGKEQEGEYNVTSTYFTEGRRATYVQNVYFSVPLGRTTMTIATPLEDKMGQRVGVLGTHINLDKMDEIMLEKGGLGTTGETYLVDKYNVFVSEARSGHEHFPRGVHTEGIDAALQGNDGTGLYKDYRGVPVIGAYRWIEDRELALLAEIDQEEAFAPVRRLGQVILLAGLMAAGLVFLAAYLSAKQIGRPVAAITDVATEIAAGNLSQRAPVLTRDEIGVLANAFNTMADEIAGMVGTLEQRVAERTRGLQAAAEVSRATTSVLDPDELLRQVVDLVRERFGLYYVGLFLLDEERRFAVLRAGTGKAGRQMLAQGHKLEAGGESMIGWCVASAKARIALDVGEEAVRFKNPLLPETRSEMALPLRSRGRVIGAMTVQSSQEAAFDEADIAVMQTMADQVAVTIDNARLFAETQAALAEMEATHRHYLGQAWTRYLQTARTTSYETERPGVAPLGNTVLSEVQQAVERQRATVLTGPSAPRQAWDSASLGRDHEAEGPVLNPALSEGEAEGESRSALVAPIALRGGVIGALGIHDEDGARQWTDDEVALVEAVTERMALAVENLRLLDETQHRAARERLTREITDSIRGAVTVEDAIQRAVREMGRALGASEMVARIGTEQDLFSRSSRDDVSSLSRDDIPSARPEQSRRVSREGDEHE